MARATSKKFRSIWTRIDACLRRIAEVGAFFRGGYIHFAPVRVACAFFAAAERFAARLVAFLVAAAFFPASLTRSAQFSLRCTSLRDRTTSVGRRPISCILWQLGHSNARFSRASFFRFWSRCATSRTAATPKPQTTHRCITPPSAGRPYRSNASLRYEPFARPDFLISRSSPEEAVVSMWCLMAGTSPIFAFFIAFSLFGLLLDAGFYMRGFTSKMTTSHSPEIS